MSRKMKFTSQHAAIFMAILGFSILILGYIYSHGFEFKNFIPDLYANVGQDFIGIAITVLIIDRLNKIRDAENQKRNLIREMGSEVNAFALKAVNELRAQGNSNGGWLCDGSLNHANLIGADLTNAYLSNADLAEANLTGAKLNYSFLVESKLKNANLSMTDLSGADCTASDLQNAILRNATCYRTNLCGANLKGAILEGTKWKEIIVDEKTILPEHFKVI